MITKADAILAINPESKFHMAGEVVTYWENVDISQPTEEEINAKIAELQAAEPMRLLRIERDQLLSATDWWCVSDRTATQEQLDYRQALRDLPETQTPALDENGNLINVNWPTPPTE